MLCWTMHLNGAPKDEDNDAAVAVRHEVYIFGGFRNVTNEERIEVHVFNTVSLHWMNLAPEETGEERPPEVPSTRYYHTAVLIEDSIYIWGGRTCTGEHCNVLYSFDVDARQWSTAKVSGTVPVARCGHSACVLGEVMYVYGGYTLLTRHYTNDMYKMDTTTMVWSLVNTRGHPPPASSRHSATIIGTKMFIFGGWEGPTWDYYNNIRVFDTEMNCWLDMPSTQVLPERRKAHSAFVYNGELYIFGGNNFKTFKTFNDLWKFNTETFSWKKVQPKGKGPSQINLMRCCMVGDRIIFFAGYKGSDTPADDLYVLDLSPSLKTLCKLAVIKYDLEQLELPRNIRWELTVMP